jgi:Sulfotransferase family
MTYAFVLGTGRCGSTLVHEVLARHPDVGFVSNVDDRLASARSRGRWNREIFSRTPERLTRKGRLRFAPSEGYRILGRQVSPALVAPVRDLVADDATPWLAERFRRFFEERAAAQGVDVFLHKFTGWPRAGFIHRALPEARFVHVIRDGRAVANSLLQMPWWRGYEGPSSWGWGPLPEPYEREWTASGGSFVTLAGLEWKLLIDAFDRAKASVPADRWMDVRYEDVVGDPRASIASILAFLDLAWTPGFERRFERHPFRTDRTDGFRRDLSVRDVDLLDRSLGGYLDRWGYTHGIPANEEASA